jgi:hypothetical protein
MSAKAIFRPRAETPFAELTTIVSGSRVIWQSIGKILKSV